MDNNLELRAATSDDLRDLGELISRAFLDDLDDEFLKVFELVDEPERARVITGDGRIVANGSILTRDLTVPGAVIPAAHVTGVAVAPTHRRRGLLNQIMTAIFDDIIERGNEPIAALWASEGAIYGRYGYGRASWQVGYKIAVRETTLPGVTPSGRLRQAKPADVRDQLASVYERARVLRPGISGRPGHWWEYHTADLKVWRRGMSELRAVLYEVDGEAEGYATWRVKGGWDDTGPKGEVAVGEVMAETVEAYAALWRFLLSIDLVRTVKYSFAAPDEPLTHLVTNPQGMATWVEPGLWIRVVDIAAALSARRYAAPIDVVLDVADQRVPANAGRWRLTGGADSATCEPTTDAPDLSLDIRELGAVYLGGTSLTTLADAGLVTAHSPAALAAASVAFGWHKQPLSIEVF
ncbi:GNAT family N-acetyltransferase [Phytoactinopolyspora alkaliphila]|uniref:GNAT family N-acetyltransferase n=1 Tax=Phytoactinopolyspora alkaliphila TaxID=1783498 RepID=A0A6N9YM35_9ACTN|nr:GNAT family N-acetyltransferase [Phytoactinopolyspora alkaliphila]